MPERVLPMGSNHFAVLACVSWISITFHGVIYVDVYLARAVVSLLDHTKCLSTCLVYCSLESVYQAKLVCAGSGCDTV